MSRTAIKAKTSSCNFLTCVPQAPHPFADARLHRIRPFFATMTMALLCIGGLLCASSASAQWTQVWGGNFPGAAGSTYDHSAWWNNVQAKNPWGDGTQQNTSDSTQNVYLDGNGNLVIAMTYTPGAAYPYTSARLTSRYAAGPYGRLDARIQNPSAQGMGAAFWSLGSDEYPTATSPENATNPSTSGGVSWPYCGELDMMEIQAQTAAHNGSTVHGSDYGTDIYVSATTDLSAPATFDNGSHIFTTQWEPYHFFFYLDGASTPYGDIDIADTAFNDTWELDQPINLLLTSGIGGNGGTPGTTGFPSNMVVSYVNYSNWSAGAPAPVTGLTATASYSNAVDLSWIASSSSGVTYDIYASTTEGTAPSQFNMVAQNVSGTTYRQTGLQPNTTYYYTVMAANFGGESSSTYATSTTQFPGHSTGMQISAGGWATGTYMTSSFVVGGNTNAHLHVPIDTSQVTTTPAPQQVYDTERYGPAAWTITGLSPGTGYNVNLHMVETTHSAAGVRNFNASINGQQVLTNFDIYQAAGGMDKAINEEFYTQADASGTIVVRTDLGTTTVSDLNPTLSGLEIIPASGTNPVGTAPGTISTLQINSGGSATAPFVPDEDFNSGTVGTAVPNQVISTSGVTNPAPQAVYQTARITPTTYELTGLQANATYNVRLHFAETYFTASNKRVFTVSVNGIQFLPALDIYSQVGENHALVNEIEVNSNKYGEITVQLSRGSENTPTISGVEAILVHSTIGAPSNLTTTGGSGEISLVWTASSTSGVQYTVYRATAGTAPVVLSTTVSGTTYTDSAVSNGTTYGYYIVATTGGGFSQNSNWASVAAAAGPSAPSSLTATTVSSSQINLSWTASTTSGVSYIVYRSTTSGFTASSSNQIGTTVAGVTTYSDTGLTASTTYYYLVEATISGTMSGPSNQGSAPTNSGSGTSIDSGSTSAVGSFVADTDYVSGSIKTTTKTIIVPASIASLAPAAVYQSARQGSSFTYTIPGFVKNSTGHSVTLLFAELYYSAAKDRLFNVTINGVQVLTNFDIYASAGNEEYAAVAEQFSSITADGSGQITISFTEGTKDQPSVNGIIAQ
jgi:fibronectin type 3 domain-containing protein